MCRFEHWMGFNNDPGSISDDSWCWWGLCFSQPTKNENPGETTLQQSRTTTVNKLLLLSSDWKSHFSIAALRCFQLQERLITCTINKSHRSLQKWKLESAGRLGYCDRSVSRSNWDVLGSVSSWKAEVSFDWLL